MEEPRYNGANYSCAEVRPYRSASHGKLIGVIMEFRTAGATAAVLLGLSSSLFAKDASDSQDLGTPEKRVEPTEQPFGRGIYELKGNELRRCFSGGNDPRPMKMESPPGKAFLLTVHRRAHAGNKPAEAEIP